MQNLKSKIAPAIITLCTSVLFLGSCESHEQKADDAFDEIQREQMISGDSAPTGIVNLNSLIVEVPLKKTELGDEWSRFRAEMDRKIENNKRKIHQLVGKKGLSSKEMRSIGELEEDNLALNKQMDVYHEEVKAEWEAFRVMMNHLVNDIDIELKDLHTTHNK